MTLSSGRFRAAKSATGCVPVCRGRGTVKGLTDFALTTLGANRIEIRCNARNRRSAAVAERAGYVLEARLHHYERDVGGELRDTLVYVKFP